MAGLIGIVNINKGAFPSLLRPSESTQGAVRTRIRLPSGQRVKAEVAVVRSSSSSKKGNEAAVIIISPPTKEEGLRILRTLPIRPATTVSLMQVPPSPSPSYFAQSSKPRIEVAIGDDTAPKTELQFEPGDSGLVTLFVREIRKAVKDSFYFEYSHTWLGFYPESEPPPALLSPLNKLRPGLERSFGRLSDASDSNGTAEGQQAVVATAANSNRPDPNSTDIKTMHATGPQASVNDAKVEAKVAKVGSGVESETVPPLESPSEFSGDVNPESDTKTVVNPALSNQDNATAEVPPAASKEDTKAATKVVKPQPLKPSPLKLSTQPNGGSGSDSDSDSDIIVTSSEPVTIERLTASLNISRTPSADRSAGTSPTTKSVRFVESPKTPTAKEILAAHEKDNTEPSDDDSSSKYPNPYAEGFDRTDFLRKRLYSRRDKWTTKKQVSLRIATYNVNDRVPPTGTKELGPLVGHGQEDIVVVGLQEADLRGSSMLVALGGDRAAAWEEAILNGFGDNRDLYEKVDMVQYVGVALFVFARSEIRTDIRRCETSARGIGILGFGGNKAGVAARMRIFDTTVCFVCSHLAAFANQLERRRYDYNALLTGLAFPAPSTSSGASQALEPYWPAKGGDALRVEDSDVLFWFGDLNYRVDLEDEELRALVESKDYSTILTADQLLTDIQDGKSFAGFAEADINFRPTFKYVHGSVTLDPKRAPAYTDRILFKTKDGRVDPKSYKPHDLLWSDHLPLAGVYSLEARVLDESKRSEQLVIAQCELDRLDEMYRPSLDVLEGDIHFGDVKFLEPVRREITLKNNGLVPATFTFRTPSDGKPICKSWFWPTPFTGTVESGQEIKINVVADVDASSTLSLDVMKDMNDVLVLQVEEGNETFIPLCGQFVPTTTGLPLDLLPRLPNAIRKLPLSERKDLLGPAAEARDASTYSENGAPPKGQPPRQIWRLLENLMNAGEVEGLWTGSVPLDEVLAVLDALDAGADAIPGSPQAVAHALLLVLYKLPAPLIPREVHILCKIVMTRDEVYAIVEKIPGVNANVLIGVTGVVRLCCGDKIDNATVKALSMALFGGPTNFMEPFVKALLEG